ncbi:hypothetical protein BJY01DRAFT_238001 [Aspergillus pseudoustus]|uniref:NAD(P)-binding protein n=1 Tax=Aspergillus pseudoustus TaxID=1810923 RepID=A0ABR4JAQ7_9EURO
MGFSRQTFVKRQIFANVPPISPDEVDLRGKTAIVTGSNIGIGLECARQILDLGLSYLILAVRSTAKGEDAREELLKGRRGEEHIVEVWQLNLSTYDSIIQFAKRARTLNRLDMVIHNAALTKNALELNPITGHDEVNQVNYLSLALLVILVLPILRDKNRTTSNRRQNPGRLVIVSSDTAACERYATSKLLGQLFLAELASRIPSSVTIVNAPNPGLCYGSGLTRDMDGGALGKLIYIFRRTLGRPTAVGARSLVDAAVRHGPKRHGQYLEDGKVQPMAPLVYTPEGRRLATVVWEETMTEFAFAGASEIITDLTPGWDSLHIDP